MDYSVYADGPFGNAPTDPAYAHGHRFLTDRLPQSDYPWEPVYDNRWSLDASDWFGSSLEYPYYLRRHRVPKVFVRPKPHEVTAPGGRTYRVADYPPYVYWYPRPVECEDACGQATCDRYYRRLNDYRMCQFCQSLREPQCWDASAQRCVRCPPGVALRPCEDQFGCRNPNGWFHTRVPPQNPKYTGCRMCS